MSLNKLKEFFKACELNDPIGYEDFEKVCYKSTLTQVPESYMEFLGYSNGAEGAVSNGSYLQLWKAEDLDELNLSYEVEENAPGFWLIGSDGGDEAIGIDLRNESETKGCYFRMPFVGMDWKEAIMMGTEITDIKIV